MSGDVLLDLRTARALLVLALIGALDVPFSAPRRLDRAIRKAERALTPGRWRDFGAFAEGPDGERRWPNGMTAIGVAPKGSVRGWWTDDPSGKPIASGPETGPAGRRKADAALRRWLKRRGVEWTP